MILEVRHLLIVQAVHEEGTVSRAARRLSLTQPAVSRALGEIEARLRVSLFERTGKRMVLTSKGATVLRTAEAVLPEIARAEQELGLIRTGEQGVLSLTTECYNCYRWLPPILAAFRIEFPLVSIQIVPEASLAPFDALQQGRVDLAITHSSPPSGLVARRLFNDELLAIVPADHALAGKEFLTAADFVDECLILQVEPEQSGFVRGVLRPAGIQPSRILNLRLTEAVLWAVASGLGISVLPRWTVSAEIEAGTLVGVRIQPEGLHRTWSAVYPAHRATNRALLAVVAHLEARALATVATFSRSTSVGVPAPRPTQPKVA